jgi:gas vesicle protein
MESTKDAGSKIKMTDNTDPIQNSPFASEFSQDQAISTSSGPALIEKFVVRLPKGLRKKIKHLSEQNRRSMNSEIIMVLEQHIEQNLGDLAHDLTDDINAALADASSESESQADELAMKLQNLPDEKKQALLELLG